MKNMNYGYIKEMFIDMYANTTEINSSSGVMSF